MRLVTEPLETMIKAINGVEHVYSNTVDDRVLVTARFLVGTKSDEAILQGAREDPRQHGSHPQRHPRTADRRPRHRRRRHRHADACPEIRGGGPLSGQHALPPLGKPADRTRQARRCRPLLHRRRPAGSDPGRTRPGEAVALRRHPLAIDRQGAGGQPLVRRRPHPRPRSERRRRRRPDAARHPRHRHAADRHPRRPAGLRPRCRDGGDGGKAARPPGLPLSQGRGRQARTGARRHHRDRQARRRQRRPDLRSGSSTGSPN